MPSRLIRDGLLTSWRYERLTGDAKLFYFHLLLTADDLGCMELGCTYIRRRVLYSQDSDERIAKLIGELQDVDLIRPYDHQGKCYGFIPRFRQRLQRTTLKNPPPPESLTFEDDDAKRKFNEIKENMAQSTVGQRIANGSPSGRQPPEVEVEVEVEVEAKFKTPLSGSAPSGAEHRRLAGEILDYLNKSAGKRFRPVDANIKLIVARLREGYTAEELKTVVCRQVLLWGDDHKMMEFLRPATLFNSTRCAQYAGELEAQA